MNPTQVHEWDLLSADDRALVSFMRVWVCGCVGVWVCGFVGMWVCGFGFVDVWVRVSSRVSSPVSCVSVSESAYLFTSLHPPLAVFKAPTLSHTHLLALTRTHAQSTHASNAVNASLSLFRSFSLSLSPSLCPPPLPPQPHR